MQSTSAPIAATTAHAEYEWPGVYALTVVFTLTTAALITLLLTLIPVGKARAAATGPVFPAVAAPEGEMLRAGTPAPCSP